VTSDLCITVAQLPNVRLQRVGSYHDQEFSVILIEDAYFATFSGGERSPSGNRALWTLARYHHLNQAAVDLGILQKLSEPADVFLSRIGA
jgi:hypothetical protein